jgi:thiol-disulfide isomerase/thioredoxin
MNKRMLTSLVIVLGIGLAIGLVWYTTVNNQDQREESSSIDQSAQQTDAAKFKQQYPKVAADNRFVFANADEVVDLFERGDGVVFLGFSECSWCQQLAPIVDEAAKAEGLDKIYYLNIREARQNNDETYRALVKKLENYLPKDKDGNPRIFVPDVTVLRQGEIVGRFEQEPTADGSRDGG